jgi:glutamine synthetase
MNTSVNPANPARRSFAQRCGVEDSARQAAVDNTIRQIKDSAVELVRVSWFDLHGLAHSKALTPAAACASLRSGVSMVSTLMLKDLAGRTVYPVFEPGGTDALPGFGQANNLMLLADPSSFRRLPWAENTGWLRADPWFTDAQPVALDARRVLQRALARLHERGMDMRCGLEVEFHIYRMTAGAVGSEYLDPTNRSPYEGPGKLSLIHPGHVLLNEAWLDMADEPLRIVQRTAQGLGLPLLSLEAEMGPSQVEAVFDVTDALAAADAMCLFRSAVRQALRRAGYHATFMCRPPFPDIMSSGWHLHQSLVSLNAPHANLFCREAPALGSTPRDASFSLTSLGEHYLAGLLHHASASAALCTPTINGFARFRPNALAPQAVLWGRDSRGAMLRVIGEAGDPSTRIENRIGEPAANPYLYMASQICAGLDGIDRRLAAPVATDSPYASDAVKLPSSLGEALAALQADTALTSGLGADFVRHFVRVKQAEVRRFEEAEDKEQFQRSEYFGRL